MNSGPAITPARRKRLLKAFGACPAGYTNEDLERFLDLLYSMFSDVYTLADERRFQAMLRSAWQKRSWHVLVADPGSGKTMGIVDFVQTTGSPAGTLPERSYPTLAVSDGADWIPKFVDYHRQDAGSCHGVCGASGPSRPRAVALPRGPHHPGGALPPFKQARFQQWLKQQRHELKTGEASKVLAELSRLQTLMQESHVESAVETITKKLAYVRERQAMLTYATFQAQDYPIRSGSLESANKLVVQSRMKGAGMCWEPAHVNAMLALRNLACNDRWDQGWQAIRQRWQQEAQAQRKQRAARSSPQPADEPSSPAVPPVQTQASDHPETPPAGMVTVTQQTLPVAERTGSQPTRPAATHPWRRPFLRRRLA